MWINSEAGIKKYLKKIFVYICAGLDNLHELTRLENYELMVDMEDFEGNKRFARYSSFKVDNECEGYRLLVSGFNNTGGAGE